MKAKEEYVDAPRETRSKDITVYAIIFLVLLVGAGIFLAVRLLYKPADAALADSKSGIIYDSSAVEGGWDQMTPEEIEAALNNKVAEGMIPYGHIPQDRDKFCRLCPYNIRARRQHSGD